MSYSRSITFEMGSGGYNAQSPRLVRIVTNAPLATVTTAGWIINSSSNSVEAILPTDIVEIAYAQGTSSAATAFFSVSIVSNVVTFSLSDSGIVLPVTNGHLAQFSGTTGAISDSGILATNVVSKAAVNTMASGGEIILDKGTGTVSTGAVTINKQSGVITGTFTTAAAGTTSVTFNNSEITATSVILVSLMGGTNAIPGVQLSCAYASAGVATLVVTNNNVAGSALSGTLIIGFVVL